MAFRWIPAALLWSALAGCSGGNSHTAADGGSASAAAVTPTARQLIMQGLPASSIVVGETYQFRPQPASSGAAVSYAVEGLPSWASFDSATGALTGTPTAGDLGLSGDITITASDGSTTGSVGPFTIRVVPGIGASRRGGGPVISGTPLAAALAGQPYAFQPVVNDSAGVPVTFAIINCPVWATFSTVTGHLSGTPDAGQSGTYADIQILVSEGAKSTALPAFSITVSDGAADVPVITGSPPTLLSVGQAYHFQPTASDPASRPLTFSAVNLPRWAAIDAASGSVSGTPGADDAGVSPNISISASNGISSASLEPFTLTVAMPLSSDVPTIAGTPSSAVAAGAAYSFQPTASDAAGRPLTFAIVDRPTWAQFDRATGRLSGTPTSADAGTYPGIVISANNGTSSAALPAFSIVVGNAATPAGPSIAGTPPTSVVAGSAYRFTPSVSGPNGATITFSVENAPAWATFDPATGELSGTPTEADVGTYTGILISASDGMASVSLPAFPISVTHGANTGVTLSWTAPTNNTNGSVLTDLAGYYIYFGTSAAQLTHSIRIADAATLSYVVSNLSPGTWYFSIVSFTTSGEMSANSAVASVDIQ